MNTRANETAPMTRSLPSTQGRSVSATHLRVVATAPALRREADEPVKAAWVPGQRFAPALSVAILQTRWLETYATPCHAHGSAF